MLELIQQEDWHGLTVYVAVRVAIVLICWVFLAMATFIDMYYGRKAAKAAGEGLRSRKYRRTFNKIGDYIRHLPVTTEFITQAEAKGRFDLERLPEDASETVRIVKVGDYDECLCIGTHVANTSEIGTFKIISHDWDEESKRWRMRFKLV